MTLTRHASVADRLSGFLFCSGQTEALARLGLSARAARLSRRVPRSRSHPDVFIHLGQHPPSSTYLHLPSLFLQTFYLNLNLTCSYNPLDALLHPRSPAPRPPLLRLNYDQHVNYIPYTATLTNY
jgi:hypothetical protein